jgi:hypothetical protein
MSPDRSTVRLSSRVTLQVLLSGRFVTYLKSFREFIVTEGCLDNKEICRHLSVLKSEHHTRTAALLYQLKALRVLAAGPVFVFLQGDLKHVGVEILLCFTQIAHFVGK